MSSALGQSIMILNSNAAMICAQKKKIRTSKSPNEILVKPLNSRQYYGWKSKEYDDMTMYPRENHARKSFPENTICISSLQVRSSLIQGLGG